MLELSNPVIWTKQKNAISLSSAKFVLNVLKISPVTCTEISTRVHEISKTKPGIFYIPVYKEKNMK